MIGCGNSKSHLSDSRTKNQKPNIIFILLDDLGKEWISQYDADDIETPNIDLLAKEGMQFNNAWSCLLYTSPSPRDRQKSRMPSSA